MIEILYYYFVQDWCFKIYTLWYLVAGYMAKTGKFHYTFNQLLYSAKLQWGNIGKSKSWQIGGENFGKSFHNCDH